MSGPRGRRRIVSAAITILIAAALAGCGGEGDGSADGSGQGVQLGDPVSLADCTDWNDGSVDERFGMTVQDAAADGATLTVLSSFGVVLVPVMLAYQAWSWWLFSGRVRAESPGYL